MLRHRSERTGGHAAASGVACTFAILVLVVVARGGTTVAPAGHGSVRAEAAGFGEEGQAAEQRDAEEFGGGAMATVARAARSGDGAALDRALADLKGRIPLAEPDPAHLGRSIVTFLYRGDEAVRSVWLPQLRYGPVPYAEDRATGGGAAPPVARFTRLGNSALWFLRLNLPNSTLLGYTIGCERVRPGGAAGEVAGDEFLDPLNPAQSSGRGSVSLLRLADAPSQEWTVRRENVRHGRVEAASVSSRILGETRRVAVYLPPGHEALSAPANLVFVFDGDWFREDLGAPAVLDNLLFERRIPPTVVVFVDNDPSTRERDLVNSAKFADFMARELRPWAVERYGASADPRRTALSGASFGGLAAAFIALRHPDVFGNVLSQSGAFWPPARWVPSMPNWAVLEQDSELIEAYVRSPRQPLRFYMDCGLYEPSMLNSNRRLRDVLRAKGYPLVYVEHPGSHNGVYWRHSIGDGFIALFGAPDVPRSPH